MLATAAAMRDGGATRLPLLLMEPPTPLLTVLPIVPLTYVGCRLACAVLPLTQCLPRIAG